MTATRKQKKLAQTMVEDAQNPAPMTAGQLLEKVGYSKHLVKQPGRVIKQKGVQEELAFLGFSLEEADNVVGFILKNGKRDENKLKAADTIYKRLGGYAPEKNLNVNIEMKDSPEIKDLTQKLNELYRGTGGSGDGGESSAVGNKAQN